MKRIALMVIAILMMGVPALAGDLYPEWGAMTNLTAAAGVSLSGTLPTYIGTIDNSAHYVVEINVNWEETGNNPSGTAGVSLYAQSGTTVGAIPFVVNEIVPTDYTNNYDQTKAHAGVTKTFIIENIPYIAVGIGKTALEAPGDTFHVRYRRMKGKY